MATHRHRDHISGFGDPTTGPKIAALKPTVVLQPWTENPDLAADAIEPEHGTAGGGPHALAAAIAGLNNMHAFAQATVSEINRRLARPHPPPTLGTVKKLAEANLKDVKAVEALRTIGQRPPLFAQFGEEPDLKDVLPGVRVEVLGPPTVKEDRGLIGYAAHSPEYWKLAEANVPSPQQSEDLFPDAQTTNDLAEEARWLMPRIDRLQTTELLSIVQLIDKYLNNTSLVLLLTVGDTRILLGGDAQLENWSFALNDPALRARLADCRVYKVGHHGSMNATPQHLLWDNFLTAARPDDQPLITILSALLGPYPSVPRPSLEDALTASSKLLDTRKAPGDIAPQPTGTDFWVETTIDL